MIREYVNRVPRPIQLLIAICIATIILSTLWFYSTRIINAVGHHFYQKEMDKARADVQRQLEDAAKQKQELERTLIELDESKKALAASDKARIEAEKVLDDKTK